MPEVIITLRENGPLLVAGPVVIVDSEGQVVDQTAARGDKPRLALCRCGHSGRKPFCDGAHRGAGFVSCNTTRDAGS